MARANNVSEPPIMSPLYDSSGALALVWSTWFRDIYQRVAYKGGNAIDDIQLQIDEILARLDIIEAELAAQLILILNNSVNIALNEARITQNEADIIQNALDIAQNSLDITQNALDITVLEAINTRDSTQILTGATETVDMTLNGLIKQTASGIETSVSNALQGRTITIINQSGGTNTLNMTVDGVYLPKIYDGESFTIFNNGTDWDLR